MGTGDDKSASGCSREWAQGVKSPLARGRALREQGHIGILQPAPTALLPCCPQLLLGSNKTCATRRGELP